MKRMWKVLCTAACSFLFLGLSAQSLDSTFSLSEKLYDQGRYSEAIYFYERVRFFSSGELSNEVLFKMGECYRRKGDPQSAKAYFDRVYFNSKEERLKQDALLAKVQSLVQQKKFPAALAEIYASDPVDVEQGQRFSFYEGICHFGRADFEQSFEAFTAAAGDDSLKVKALKNLYSETAMLYRPRPALAKKLSYFLPGLGQFYAGDLKNGFNSLALNAAFMALAVNVGINYSFVDALLAIMPWLQRYYIGGTDKAKMIAEKKLLENRQAFYLEAISIFDQNLTSPPTQP